MEKLLKDYNLSPNQYFFLMAIHEKTIPFKITSDEIEDLRKRHYFVEDDSGLYLSGTAIKIFTKEDSTVELFEEIWNLYPSRTPNGRVLRSKDKNSQMASRIFTKLRKELTKYNNYKLIKNGLINYIKNKEKTNGLNFMQSLEVWVNQKTWESYQEEESNNDDSSVFTVG